MESYYKDETAALFLADSFELLPQMTPQSVDMIFADPPYFLSNDGISCNGGKVVSVNKGNWDKISNFTENRAVKAPCFSYGDESARFIFHLRIIFDIIFVEVKCNEKLLL